MRIRISVAAIFWLASWCETSTAYAARDDGILAMYNISKTAVTISVCGSTKQESGCFGFARMHPPFEQACAVLEGSPSTNGNVVTRDVYVLDKRQTNTDTVNLYIYTRTDTFSHGADTLSIALKTKFALTDGIDSTTGGAGAHCSMAASDTTIIAGTDTSDLIAVINKTTNSIFLMGGSGPLISLFADERGYIAIDAQKGFLIMSPDGRGGLSGGGHEALVGTRRALTIDDLRRVRRGNHPD